MVVMGVYVTRVVRSNTDSRGNMLSHAPHARTIATLSLPQK